MSLILSIHFDFCNQKRATDIQHRPCEARTPLNQAVGRDYTEKISFEKDHGKMVGVGL